MKTFNMVLSFWMFLAITTLAQPDLSSRRMIEGVQIYNDIKAKGVFYYLPNDIKIRTNTDSLPEFKFIMMRYIGTKVTGDQGAFTNQNIIRFNVLIPPYKQAQLKSIKNAIGNHGLNVELKPLPINRMDAFLIFPFTSKDLSAPAKDSAMIIASSYLSQTSSKWEEKNIVLKPDNAAAQIIDAAFKEKKVIMSMAFAYYTVGTYHSFDETMVEGFGAYADQLKALIDSIQPLDSAKTAIVKAGAIEIMVDTKKCGGCVKKVDVMDYVPADYPTLEVYCYDFNNQIRDDLYAKKLEVMATSVSGQKISSGFTFKKAFPDVYASNLSFDYAIKLDVAPAYRVTEIFQDGREEKSEWITKGSWNGIIDITTKH